MSIFLIFFLVFSVLSSQSFTTNTNTLSIEINSGKVKKHIFSILSNNLDIKNSIQKNLIYSDRFSYIDSSQDFDAMQKKGIDFCIIVELTHNEAVVKIFDIFEKREIKKVTIAFTPGTSLTKIANIISNIVYQNWVNEPGLFTSSIIFAKEIDETLCALVKIDYSKEEGKIISMPISYLSDIAKFDNNLYLTKFSTKHRGHAIYRLNLKNKKFYKVLSADRLSVWSPFVSGGYLYFSTAKRGTTSIIRVPYHENAYHFESFQALTNFGTLIKHKQGKIATSFNKGSQEGYFCTNYFSKGSAIFTQNGIRVSQEQGSYYEPNLFDDSKMAAIKVFEGKFHLIVIDLVNKTERVLFSKYFISKPNWSPCGNWLTVSAREKGGIENIYIFHKSGKFIKQIKTNFNARNPVWIDEEKL